ncbi:hypothetical protein AAVH_18016 [Aphelenchoides avenae]|nr:hypothetical protein AAVH_18016 [Aphelenchus avenae]
MSKPPHNPQAPASASEELVELMKAAANDVLLLREVIGSNDIDSVAAAIAALLNEGSASAPNDSALRKKAPNRPCRSLPVETFVEVVLFADRDTLDTMQLVCSFLLNFIRERELTQLPLRAIPKVNIGRSFDRYGGGGGEYWLPVAEKLCDRGAGKELVPKSLQHLVSCLRLAFCDSLFINLAGAPEVGEPLSILFGMLFNDLIVGTLTFIKCLCDVNELARGIEAFKSVKTVSVEYDWDSAVLEPLGENFLVSAAQHGVRHIELKPESRIRISVKAANALSFGFTEPTVGGDRSLLGVSWVFNGAKFLAQVRQKVADLDEARHVDFTFKLANIGWQIDSIGFKKYQKDEGRTWLINDLENHVNVEVKQNENLVEIHVFSSG